MLLRRGAEAEIHLTEWMGRPVIQKIRIAKTYRLREIDQELRERRTKKEAVLMVEARQAGIAVPIIYDVDGKNSIITMQYLKAPRVKDILDGMTRDDQRDLCQMLGKEIAKLHRNELIHGDITTSNLVFMNQRIYFIDFGLGEKSQEDEVRGVDLHLLMEAFKAAHRNPQCFEWVMDEYKKYFPDGDIIEKKIEAIRRRGRYMRRVE